MAVKRYDGSAWQVVAGKGDQGTSSSISTWVKTASGGETSLSGNDDNSQSLSYTVGQELVFINGTLLKRGSDYTATNGTSITGLTALAANDVATVWTVNAFSVTGAIANTIVDAKGDLLVGTAADTPGRLAVGTDGQYLKADSTSGTGLAWGTVSTGLVKQIVFGSTSTTVSVNNSTTYVDSNLTATITPTSTSSTILVIVTQQIDVQNNAALVRGKTRLMRGATQILELLSAPKIEAAASGVTYNDVQTSIAYSYQDSPATTSATTYKTQIALQDAGAGRFCVANPTNGSSIILMELGA